ncbi:MAG: hypothetical protein WC273_02900 [Dehalococcoidia bacterium]
MPTTNDGSLRSSARALGGALSSANSIVPGAIVVGALLAAGLIAVLARHSSTATATVTILVVVTSLVVFTATKSYGEASFALVAGLLTVLTVDWTPGRFIVFAAAWLAFSLLALIISSVGLAAKTETIYVQAAIAVSESGDPDKDMEKQLREIGNYRSGGVLGPVERAEVLRTFAIRRIPVAIMAGALKTVETVSVATDVDSRTVALFLADVLRSTDRLPADAVVPTVDAIYKVIKASPVPPDEFFAAFRECRHLALSGSIGLVPLLRAIQDSLGVGIPVSEMRAEVLRIIGAANTDHV